MTNPRLRGRHAENSSKASVLSQRMLELDSKIEEAQGVIDGCDGDIVGLRKVQERRGQLEARREAIISENARKLANMKTEMTESLEVGLPLLAMLFCSQNTN